MGLEIGWDLPGEDDEQDLGGDHRNTLHWFGLPDEWCWCDLCLYEFFCVCTSDSVFWDVFLGVCVCVCGRHVISVCPQSQVTAGWAEWASRRVLWIWRDLSCSVLKPTVQQCLFSSTTPQPAIQPPTTPNLTTRPHNHNHMRQLPDVQEKESDNQQTMSREPQITFLLLKINSY